MPALESACSSNVTTQHLVCGIASAALTLAIPDDKPSLIVDRDQKNRHILKHGNQRLI